MILSAIAAKLQSRSKGDFKGRHCEWVRRRKPPHSLLEPPQDPGRPRHGAP